ncbi:MAG: sigma-54 dependent transcriptional regulator [Gemmatales bacterium]|nr:sigma-54 dependent transcriptional regulator [Gemmatales bacterium]MDW8386071.1 sigma-54 dependent transcriptional regulator [Gemmatales bacterium]
MTGHILLIDDEHAVCWALERAFRREGWSVSVAASAEEGLQAAAKKRPDAVLLDVRLPGMSGLEALAQLREVTQDAPIIVATAHGNLEVAVQALGGGAFDYLAKPFELDRAIETVSRAVRERRQQSRLPKDELGGMAEETDIVGRSPAMQEVFKRIALVAPSNVCVLITGESGTGKEIVARAIHRYSLRRDRPFLPVHIAALNPNLVESELFGHVRGAFTGATAARPGLFTLADGGTVFLDELADISLQVQVKLLRVLEHGEALAVGSSQPQRFDIRILAATHQDLRQAVAEGRFREDLLYRLSVFHIHLPPLRERPEDIGPLAEHFLRRLAPQFLPLADETLTFLRSLPWFGNVRELRNALEHAIIMARRPPLLPLHFPVTLGAGTSLVNDPLPQAVRRWLAERLRAGEGKPPTNLHAELTAAVEKILLEDVLQRVHGNRWEAARWLGLNRATVRKKLGQYGLSDTGIVKPDLEGEDDS